MKDSFITPGHVQAFQAVTSRLYDNITLWSCRIDGEPGVAIVMVDHVGDSVAVMPLFVAVTPAMVISFDGAREASDGGGGGPKRSATQEFAVAKEFIAGPRVG